MLTPEQLDNYFIYHAPTDETAPRYAAVRAAETQVAALLRDMARVMRPESQAEHATVDSVTRAFAEAIDAACPDSADKDAAIRCVRLARNALNEYIITGVMEYLRIAGGEVTKARWQANSAIACGGK